MLKLKLLKLQTGVAFGATPVCCSFCNCLQAVSTLKESIVAFALSLVLEFRDPLFAVLGCDLAFFYSMVLTPVFQSGAALGGQVVQIFDLTVLLTFCLHFV